MFVAVCPCGEFRREYGSHVAAAMAAERHGRRCGEATERVLAAGFPVQRTEAEWVTHPHALDDLLRVLGGTSLKTIESERRAERQARGAA